MSKTHDESPGAPAEIPANRDHFLAAMAAAATGVSVVTTDGPAGRYGVTISAMTSVSADPPMLLVCVNRRSPACAALLANRLFGVNVLAADQAEVADVFAGRPRQGAPFHFAAERWVPGPHGTLGLLGAAACFECRVTEAVEAGSHVVVIGRVLVAARAETIPLVYAQRGYARPAPID
jgi:flavin reductase